MEWAEVSEVEEGISHMWTCSALQNHPHAVLMCDEVGGRLDNKGWKDGGKWGEEQKKILEVSCCTQSASILNALFITLPDPFTRKLFSPFSCDADLVLSFKYI